LCLFRNRFHVGGDGASAIVAVKSKRERQKEILLVFDYIISVIGINIEIGQD
jgi:hypothetical protein